MAFNQGSMHPSIWSVSTVDTDSPRDPWDLEKAWFKLNSLLSNNGGNNIKIEIVSMSMIFSIILSCPERWQGHHFEKKKENKSLQYTVDSLWVAWDHSKVAGGIIWKLTVDATYDPRYTRQNFTAHAQMQSLAPEVVTQILNHRWNWRKVAHCLLHPILQLYMCSAWQDFTVLRLGWL